MADRLDANKGPGLGGLSIWVALTGFFSSSSQRDKTKAAVKAAKAAKAEKHSDSEGAGTQTETDTGGRHGRDSTLVTPMSSTTVTDTDSYGDEGHASPQSFLSNEEKRRERILILREKKLREQGVAMSEL